jgi:hypothetical protein
MPQNKLCISDPHHGEQAPSNQGKRLVLDINKGREKVWDGRGHALDAARLTIGDGRLANDMRLKLPHYRIMAHVGRQNGQRGFLRVSQTELAERWGCHRNTVNRAFAELVAWGYLDQRTQHDAGESFCQYRVRLDNGDGSLDAKLRAGRGGCNAESAPQIETSALTEVHSCTVDECTSAQRESALPVYRERAHRLSPTDADRHPLPPTALTPREAGERGDHSRPGLNTRGWKADWDEAARNAVHDLLGTDLAHVATDLLVPVVGTLGPPKGVHGASYVRDLAEMVGEYPPEVLAVVTQSLRHTRKYDLPAICDVLVLARSVAPMAGAQGKVGPGAGRTGPDTDAWIAALARGDGADPTIALCRQLVQRLGAEVAVAWFCGVEVQRDGARLLLLLPKPFFATYVARNLAHDVLIAARGEWPDVSEEYLTITARGVVHAA